MAVSSSQQLDSTCAVERRKEQLWILCSFALQKRSCDVWTVVGRASLFFSLSLALCVAAGFHSLALLRPMVSSSRWLGSGSVTGCMRDLVIGLRAHSRGRVGIHFNHVPFPSSPNREQNDLALLSLPPHSCSVCTWFLFLSFFFIIFYSSVAVDNLATGDDNTVMHYNPSISKYSPLIHPTNLIMMNEWMYVVAIISCLFYIYINAQPLLAFSPLISFLRSLTL